MEWSESLRSGTEGRMARAPHRCGGTGYPLTLALILPPLTGTLTLSLDINCDPSDVEVAGYARQHGSLSYVIVRAAGHIVPGDQP